MAKVVIELLKVVHVQHHGQDWLAGKVVEVPGKIVSVLQTGQVVSCGLVFQAVDLLAGIGDVHKEADQANDLVLVIDGSFEDHNFPNPAPGPGLAPFLDWYPVF